MRILLLMAAFAASADTSFELDGVLDLVGVEDQGADTNITYNQEGNSVQLCIGLTLTNNGSGGGGSGTNAGWDSTGATIVLSNSDTLATNPGTNNLNEYAKSVTGHSSSYTYGEIVLTEQGQGTSQLAVGVVQGSPVQNWLGSQSDSVGAWLGGNVYNNGGIITSSSGMSEGDVVRIWQRDGQKVWIEYHDGTTGTMIGGGDPQADTSPTFTFASPGTIYLAVTPYGTTTIQSAATLRTTEAEFTHGMLSATAWDAE